MYSGWWWRAAKTQHSDFGISGRQSTVCLSSRAIKWAWLGFWQSVKSYSDLRKLNKSTFFPLKKKDALKKKDMLAWMKMYNSRKNFFNLLKICLKYFKVWFLIQCFLPQDTVTSAVFVPNSDLIVSGSDDRWRKHRCRKYFLVFF